MVTCDMGSIMIMQQYSRIDIIDKGITNAWENNPIAFPNSPFSANDFPRKALAIAIERS